MSSDDYYGKVTHPVSTHMKTYLRDLLPARLQVPVKYWHSWALNRLEREMKLLELIVAKEDLVIDVGANRGIYTYRLVLLGARVEAFEPNPACQKVLREWANGKPCVNLNEVGLSNREDITTLHIPIGASGIEHDASATIENCNFTHSRQQVVSLRTLDGYQFKDVTMMKIDVEGHEYDVLDGAANTLTSSKPALLVEIEARHNYRPIGEVFQKILDFGYQGFFLGKDGLTALKHFNASNHQALTKSPGSKNPYINNFLFLHRDKLAAGEYHKLLEGHPLK